MNLEARINDAMLTLVRRTDPEASRVIEIEDGYSGQGCDTCGFGAGAEVNITYVRTDGRHRVHTWDRGLAALVREFDSL